VNGGATGGALLHYHNHHLHYPVRMTLSKSRLLALRSIMRGNFWARRRRANSSTRSCPSALSGDARLHSVLRCPGTKPILAIREPTASIRTGSTSPALDTRVALLETEGGSSQTNRSLQELALTSRRLQRSVMQSLPRRKRQRWSARRHASGTIRSTKY
jgi:hypothetical protein